MTTEASSALIDEQPVTRIDAPWTVKDMVWASIAAAMFTGLGIMIAVVIAVVGMLLFQRDLAMGPFMLLALASEALLLVPAWVWGPIKYGGGWKALGMRRFKLVQAIVLLVVAAAVVLGVNLVWGLVRERLGWPGQPDISGLFGEGLGGLLWALLLGGIVAPVAEEVFFRGYLYAGMRARWGVRKALVFSSLLFAAVHLSPGTLVPLFVMGLVLAYLYERSDSLWLSIILHALNNSAAFLMMYLAA